MHAHLTPLACTLYGALVRVCVRAQHGGFLPAVKQLANVAALPGIVKVRVHGEVEDGR